MKRISFYALLAILQIGLISFLPAQEANFEIKVQYLDSDDLTWGVIARPTTGFEEPNDILIGSGQITLLLKNNGVDQIQNISSVNGRWNSNPISTKGPLEAPSINYVSVSLANSGRPFPIKNNKEFLLFTFQASSCLDTVGLIENNIDPFTRIPNSNNSSPGIDLSILVPSTGQIYNWKNNYAPFAHSCKDCDEDGIVDALEDTNGDGVFTPNEDASNLCNNDMDELATPAAPSPNQRACITINEVSFQSPSSCGATDGSITVDATHETGNTIQYSIDGGRTWNNNPIIGGLQSGITYDLELRDNIGLCFESYGEVILENPNCTIDPCEERPFSVTDFPDQTICQGESTTLNASTGGVTYAWSPSTGLSASNIASPTVNITTTTTYTVIVTNEEGCTAIDDITITVTESASANAGIDQTICSETTAQLTASEGSNYDWSPTTGLNNPTIKNPIATPATSTTYTVIVTDGNGCTATDEVTITIAEPTSADAGIDQTICLGSSAQLAATGGSSYNWSPATGLNNATIENPIATPTTPTTYTVTVTDRNGCTATDVVTVSIADNLTVSLGTDVMICPDEVYTLSASGGTSYNWSPTEGLDDANSSTPSASISTSTTYCVTVTDDNGCTGTDCITIEIDSECETEEVGEGSNSGETVNPCIIGPAVVGCPDKFMCPNDQVQLVVNGGIRWEWSPTTGLDDPTSPSPKASPSQTTTYTVTGFDANGCSATDEVEVIVVTSGNCDLVPPGCQDDNLLIQEEVCIDATDNSTQVCLPYPQEDLNVTFTISLASGTPAIVHGCGFTETYSYQYNFLPEEGLGTNYRVKSWSLNDMFQTGMVNSMQELLSLMQEADPSGNWYLDANRFSIIGGTPNADYGDLTIHHGDIKTVLRKNTTHVPTGTLVEVDMEGKDREVLTFIDLVTGCSDQIVVRRCQ